MENYEKILQVIKEKDHFKFNYIFPDSSSIISQLYCNRSNDSKSNGLYQFFVENILEYTDFFNELLKINSYEYSYFIGDVYKSAIFFKFDQIDKIIDELKKISKIDTNSYLIKHIVDSVFDYNIQLLDLLEAFSRNEFDITSTKYFNKNIVQSILDLKTKNENQVDDILLSLKFLKKKQFDFNILDYNQKNLIDIAYFNMCDLRIIKWLNDEVTNPSGMEDIFFSNVYKHFEPYNNYLIHGDIFNKYPLFREFSNLNLKMCNLPFPKDLKNIYKLKSLKNAIENTLGFCSKKIYKAVSNKIVYFEESKQIINHHLFIFLMFLNEILVVNIEKKNIDLIVKLIDDFNYKNFGYDPIIRNDLFSNLRLIFNKLNYNFVEKMVTSELGISCRMCLISEIINKHPKLILGYIKYFKKSKLHKKIHNLHDFYENINSYITLVSTKEEMLPIVKKNNIKFDKYTFKQAKTNIELILWGMNQKNCVGSQRYSTAINNGRLRIYGIFIEEDLVGIVSVHNESDVIDELQFLGFNKDENSELKYKFTIEKIFGGDLWQEKKKM